MSFDPLGLDQGPDTEPHPYADLPVRRVFGLTPEQLRRFTEWRQALAIVFEGEIEDDDDAGLLWRGFTFSFTPVHGDPFKPGSDQVVIRHNGTGRELRLNAE